MLVHAANKLQNKPQIQLSRERLQLQVFFGISAHYGRKLRNFGACPRNTMQTKFNANWSLQIQHLLCNSFLSSF